MGAVPEVWMNGVEVAATAVTFSCPSMAKWNSCAPDEAVDAGSA
jgi:hypothetical protein